MVHAQGLIQIPMALCGVGRWEPMGAVQKEGSVSFKTNIRCFSRLIKDEFHLMVTEERTEGLGPYSGTCTGKILQEEDSQKTMCLL